MAIVCTAASPGGTQTLFLAARGRFGFTAITPPAAAVGAPARFPWASTARWATCWRQRLLHQLRQPFRSLRRSPTALPCSGRTSAARCTASYPCCEPWLLVTSQVATHCPVFPFCLQAQRSTWPLRAATRRWGAADAANSLSGGGGGGNLPPTDATGITALHVAAANGWDELLDCLLEVGAERGRPVPSTQLFASWPAPSSACRPSIAHHVWRTCSVLFACRLAAWAWTLPAEPMATHRSCWLQPAAGGTLLKRCWHTEQTSASAVFEAHPGVLGMTGFAVGYAAPCRPPHASIGF